MASSAFPVPMPPVPGLPTTKEWSNEYERSYQEKARAFDALKRGREKHLLAVRIALQNANMPNVYSIEDLVAHATEIRAALKPFDFAAEVPNDER